MLFDNRVHDNNTGVAASLLAWVDVHLRLSGLLDSDIFKYAFSVRRYWPVNNYIINLLLHGRFIVLLTTLIILVPFVLQVRVGRDQHSGTAVSSSYSVGIRLTAHGIGAYPSR